VTFTPLEASSFAVPPVDRIETPKSASERANSARPVLSETLASACRMRMSFYGRKGGREKGEGVRAVTLPPSPFPLPRR